MAIETWPRAALALAAAGCLAGPGCQAGAGAALGTADRLLGGTPATVLQPPSKVVHDGGIVFVAQRALLKDRTDGFALVGGPGAGYRVQAIYQNLLAVSESAKPEGTFGYFLAESTASFRIVETRTRNRATASGSFDVPDADIVSHVRATVESTLSVPAEAPPGAQAHLLGMELVKAPFPLRGTVATQRVYVPGSGGGRDRELRQVQTSRDLRFELPEVPGVHGQPFVLKKLMYNYMPVPGADDLPLVEDEQQVWPDGMVLQQVLTRDADLRGFSLKGTMILPESGNRQPINFDRRVNLATDAATTTIRNLDGIVVEFRYGKGKVFAAGEIREARGRLLARLQPAGGDRVKLTFEDGKSETIEIK
ncbi:MAG: hypothetical protein FJZ01_13625 [Candidatus Sericytochromatia bacterium]|nr:hypothetical protein [Candidatus Tanganyikabacteria bacterium]